MQCPGGDIAQRLGEADVVEFKKLNGEVILINPFQIEAVELIPESKVIMMNGRFHIVMEDKEEIIQRITRYRKEIYGTRKAEE